MLNVKQVPLSTGGEFTPVFKLNIFLLNYIIFSMYWCSRRGYSFSEVDNSGASIFIRIFLRLSRNVHKSNYATPESVLADEEMFVHQ